MLRSLNSGVSGLKGFQTKLDVIGNNIANVNTVGFKKGRVVFEDIFSQTIKGATGPTQTAGANPAPLSGGTNPIQVGLGTRVGSIDTLHTPGSPTTTNIGTDLYLDGDAFFVVENASQKQFLTRAGNFTLDSSNNLVNQNGMFVVGQDGGKITIPDQYITFSIDANGSIIGVNPDGTSEDSGLKIGTIAVDNPKGLLKAGGSLYSLTPNADSASIATLLTEGSNAQVIAGALEMSNVDLSEELTEMITAQRGFQANSKIITVSDQILEELVNLKR
ncbi:flagellar hook-basal body complex protein [Neobacillus niacini]|uniref:flagellar hook-basal body complex protein n=1 Tax=Neobacillus niacini TaxID=86668 RepID=UPI00052FB251|nr:flagellar hook-basal body complex protein [Neobacillus niacini]KGM46474.1 flagellar basal body rod protein FlgG [Neobacillus niacini]MEC1522166.1 flagellar hook-basal body complex protein [Neobacillus niacini]